MDPETEPLVSGGPNSRPSLSPGHEYRHSRRLQRARVSRLREEVKGGETERAGGSTLTPPGRGTSSVVPNAGPRWSRQGQGPTRRGQRKDDNSLEVLSHEDKGGPARHAVRTGLSSPPGPIRPRSALHRRSSLTTPTRVLDHSLRTLCPLRHSSGSQFLLEKPSRTSGTQWVSGETEVTLKGQSVRRGPGSCIGCTQEWRRAESRRGGSYGRRGGGGSRDDGTDLGLEGRRLRRLDRDGGTSGTQRSSPVWGPLHSPRETHESFVQDNRSTRHYTSGLRGDVVSTEVRVYG